MIGNGKLLHGSFSGLLPLLMVTVAAQAQAQAQATADRPADPGEVAGTADIVVTASKREQKLRDVPSAISVLSSDSLERQGIQSVRDYATLTPGLGLRDQGRPGVGTIFIRGLTTGAGQQSATTVVYLDDVPFTSSSPESGSSLVAPEPELADLDRIEVLKGPQGTLYGASSLGGVVRLISKRPDASRFSGNARVEGTAVDGGGTGYTFRATANIPLITDQLALRATGFYRRAPGFVDNVGTGNKNVNDSVTKGGRLALGWTPSADLTIDLVGQIQNTDTNGIAYQSDISGTLIPLYGKRKYSQFFDAKSSIKHRLISATVNYDVGLGKIIGTASYLDSRTSFTTDSTDVYSAYLPAFAYPAGTGLALLTGIRLKKETAELRFVSNRLGPVEFVAGGFLTHEHTIAPTHVAAMDAATNTQLAAPFGTFIIADVADTYDEVATFGNATLYLSDRLDVTGGLRFAHNKEDNALIYGGMLFGGSSLPPEKSHFSDNVLTYLATVRWRPTDTLSTFLRAASGYRPGGPQTNPNPPAGAQTKIRPDTVWNYEAGLKGDFIDHTLSVEASVYHIDWKNVQLNSTYGGIVLLENAAKAEVDGFELQAMARPSRLLSVGFNIGYTDARITRIDPGVTAAIGAAKGDPLPLTPKWTAAMTLDQRIPLPGELEGQLGATLRHQSRMFNSYPGSQTDIDIRLPEITTLDLRAGLLYRKYQIQFRAENIFDRNGVTNVTTSNLYAGQGVPSMATVIRPRSFTVSLSAQF